MNLLIYKVTNLQIYNFYLQSHQFNNVYIYNL